MTHAPRHRRGFTLLELLLAMTVTGIIATVLYSSLRIGFNARDAAIDEVSAVVAGRQALEVVRADIAGVLPPRGVLTGAMIGSDETSTSGYDSDTLSFVTNSAVLLAEQPLGDLRRVELAISDVDDNVNVNGGRLVRSTISNLLATTEQTAASQVLADRVVAMNIRYHNGTDWVDAWDSGAEGNNLPTAIEMTLTLLPRDMKLSDADPQDQLLIVRRVFNPLMAPSAAQRQLENAGG
jgi:type II secretion system protein J